MVSTITYLQSCRQWFMREKRLAGTGHHGAVYQIEKAALTPDLQSGNMPQGKSTTELR